jgi:hypothetical protein
MSSRAALQDSWGALGRVLSRKKLPDEGINGGERRSVNLSPDSICLCNRLFGAVWS